MTGDERNLGAGRAQRGAARPQMVAEHAVLGLLAIEGGPGHGYDLARHFSAGQPLAEVLRLESGMLYHHLKKLERAGWVAGTIEPQGNRPPRQVYRLSESGRAELERWLREPVARTREIRLEFLVKLYFARQLTPDIVGTLIGQQRTILLGLQNRLNEQLNEQLAERDATDASQARAGEDFRRLVLDLRLTQTVAALQWLETVAPTDGIASGG